MCHKAQALVIATEALAQHYSAFCVCFFLASKGNLVITFLFMIAIVHLPPQNTAYLK